MYGHDWLSERQKAALVPPPHGCSSFAQWMQLDPARKRTASPAKQVRAAGELVGLRRDSIESEWHPRQDSTLRPSD